MHVFQAFFLGIMIVLPVVLVNEIFYDDFCWNKIQGSYFGKVGTDYRRSKEAWPGNGLVSCGKRLGDCPALQKFPRRSRFDPGKD